MFSEMSTRPRPIMLGLSMLAFFLRAYRLDAQSYWIDEAWTIFYANLSLTDLWQYLQTIRAAPPLYHILTIYWIKLVGDGEYELRFLSLLFSVMAVPLTYRLGKKVGGARLGLIAALLIAVSPYQIWHAQDARNYSLLTATTIMSMWSFFNLWQRGGWRWWLIYVISTQWAIFTHYHGLVIIGIQGLLFLLAWRRYWPFYLRWAGTLLVILTPLAAWLIFGSRLWQSDHWLPQVGLTDSYLRNAIAYSVGELTPRSPANALTSIFVMFYILGLIYAGWRSWRKKSNSEIVILLLVYTLTPNVAIWVYSQLGTSVYLERYLIPIQVGYLLTISLGILAILDYAATFHRPNFLKQFLSTAGALLILAILTGISGWVLYHHYNDPVYAKPNWRGLIRMIEAFSLPGDAILLTGDGGEKLFDYYYRGELPVYDSFNTPAPPPDEARRRIAHISASHDRLWYTPYGVDIDGILESWLVEHSYPAWQSWLGRKRLALYNTQADLPRQEMLNLLFTDEAGQGPTLVKLNLPNIAIPAGDLLPLNLTWLTKTSLARDYQLSLRLLNNRGDIFMQSDWPPLASVGLTSSWPLDQAIIDRRSLWIPPDTPPGNYLLQLVVYNPASGQALGQPGVVTNILISPAKINPPLEILSIPNLIQNPDSAQKVAGESSGQKLQLVGYLLPEQIQPGQEMWLWLYWQAKTSLPSNITLQLRLKGEGEAAVIDFPLSDSTGPLESWQPGQVRRAVYHLPTNPRLAGETAELEAILQSEDGTIINITASQVKLVTRSRQFEVPAITQSVDHGFGQPILLRLLGYDLTTDTLVSGDKLPLTLYWQAEAEIDIDYTVFLQLLNDAGQVVTQVDLQPQAGAAPTTTWLPGEVLTDPYTLTLPLNLSSGQYRLITGLYDATTGERLTEASGANFVEFGTITVK